MVLIQDHPSPNHDERPEGQAVDILVLHYTGMQSAQAAVDKLCDETAEGRVSAHYVIDEDGTTLRLVPEHRRAWHAGLSHWAGANNINGRSLGIELINPGHEFGYQPFPEPQMAALIELTARLLTSHPIPPSRVVGHSDVAPLRKTDPGELFDWPRLVAEGLAIWPEAGAPIREDQAKAKLAAFGYGYLEEDFTAVLRAVQRRFRPSAITGALDDETARLIDGLPAKD